MSHLTLTALVASFALAVPALAQNAPAHPAPTVAPQEAQITPAPEKPAD